jgi:hypothetical protein
MNAIEEFIKDMEFEDFARDKKTTFLYPPSLDIGQSEYPPQQWLEAFNCAL